MNKGPIFCPVCLQEVMPQRTQTGIICVSGRRWVEVEFLPDSREIILTVHKHCAPAFVEMVERGEYPPLGIG